MANDPKEVLAKLIKMRDGAAAIGSAEEASAFASKVSELLLKHKLSLSDIDLSTQDKDEPVSEFWLNGTKERKVAWEIDLAVIIAKFHFCKLLTSHKGNSLLWIGRPSDRDVAVFLFTTLVRDLEKIQNKEYTALYNNNPRQAKGFRAAFRVGALAAISKRLRELRQQVVCTENAIVRVNTADAAVTKYFDNIKKGDSRKMKHDSASNSYGYERGTLAGNSVNLNPNAVTGTAKKALR